MGSRILPQMDGMMPQQQQGVMQMGEAEKKVPDFPCPFMEGYLVDPTCGVRKMGSFSFREYACRTDVHRPIAEPPQRILIITTQRCPRALQHESF